MFTKPTYPGMLARICSGRSKSGSLPYRRQSKDDKSELVTGKHQVDLVARHVQLLDRIGFLFAAAAHSCGIVGPVLRTRLRQWAGWPCSSGSVI